MFNEIFQIIESKMSETDKIKKLMHFSENDFSIYKIKDEAEKTWYSRKKPHYITPLSLSMYYRHKKLFQFILEKNTSLKELKNTSEAPKDLQAIMEVQGINNINPFYLKKYFDKYENLLSENIKLWDFYIEFDNDNNCDYLQCFHNAMISKNKSHRIKDNFIVFCENKLLRNIILENIDFIISYASFYTDKINRDDIKGFLKEIMIKYPESLSEKMIDYYNKKSHNLLITECIKESKIIKYHVKKHKDMFRSVIFKEIYNGVEHVNHEELIKLYKFARKNKFSLLELKKITEECIDRFKNRENQKNIAQSIVAILDKKILNKKLRNTSTMNDSIIRKRI